MEVSFYKSLLKAIVQGSFIPKFMKISKLFSIDGWHKGRHKGLHKTDIMTLL